MTNRKANNRIIIAALLCFALILFPYMGAYAGIGGFSASAADLQLSPDGDSVSSDAGQALGEPDGAVDPGTSGSEPEAGPDDTSGADDPITDDPDADDGPDDPSGADDPITDEPEAKDRLISDKLINKEDSAEPEEDLIDIDLMAMTVSLMEAGGAITDETALRAAIASPTPDNPIILGGDITLTSTTLTIPKNITLTSDAGGPYSLIGVDGLPTITVTAGTLTLESIIVTHDPGAKGSGVEIKTSSKLILDGGCISGNTVTGNGGGILANGDFEMKGGSISNNTAGGSGGGIYFTNSAIYGGIRIEISGGSITGNKAETGDGGGIGFQNPKNYDKLFIATGVTFSGNSASVGYHLGLSEQSVIDIHNDRIAPGVTWTSPFEYGYNNYDICYQSSGPPVVTYTVTFDLQGGTLSANSGPFSVPTGGSLGARMPGDPVRTGYTFKGWWTNGDGTGTLFTSSTILNASITVYAIWEIVIIDPPVVMYTVTFNLQGGTLSANPGPFSVPEGGTLGAKMPGNPVRTNYTFKGWRTNSDGTGTLFTSSTVVNANITVYAIWELIKADPPDKPPVDPPVKPPVDPPDKPPVDPPYKPPVNPPDNPSPTPPPKNTTSPLSNLTSAGTSGPAAANGQPELQPGPVTNTTPETPAREEIDPLPEPTSNSGSEPLSLNTQSVLSYNQGKTPEEVLAMLKDEGVPILSLGGQEMPLSAGWGQPVWAPVNQILMTIGIVMVASNFFQWMKRRKVTGEQANRWLNTAVILVIAGAIVFIMTQDTRNLMVLFDLWTPVSAAIFAGALINLRYFTRSRAAG